MKTKLLTLLTAGSLALMMQACGDDSSSSSLVEFEGDDSSSSVETEKDSSDSKTDVKSSDSKAEAKSSESKEDVKSSDSKDDSESAGSSDDEEKPADLTKLKAYVFTSDYVSGALRWMENGKLSKASETFFKDSKLVDADGNIFILERMGADNIALLDKDSKKVKWQQALDANGNPSDVVVRNGYAWVVEEDGDAVYCYKVADGEIQNAAIDLSGYVLEDGTSAHTVDLEVSGDTLFVLMQQWYGSYPSITYPKGTLALFKLDETDDDLISKPALAEIELLASNPMSVKVVNGQVYVASHGEYNASYGADADAKRGLEKVNLKTETSELIVSGAVLGGGVMSMDADYSNGILYAGIRTPESSKTTAVKINPVNKTVTKIGDFSDIDGRIAYDASSKLLIIGDHGRSTEDYMTYLDYGVFVYDGKNLQKVEFADEATLPPYSIAF